MRFENIKKQSLSFTNQHDETDEKISAVYYRLAANNEQFLTKVLGIKDPKHRSKITIKAMDVVLFGPPKG